MTTPKFTSKTEAEVTAEIAALTAQLTAMRTAEAARRKGSHRTHVTDHTTANGCRRLEIAATNSLLNQSILLLGSQNECLVKTGEPMEITTDDGHVIRTEAVSTGVKLKARKEVRAFLKRHKAGLDSVLTLLELSPGKWHLAHRLKSQGPPVEPSLVASPPPSPPQDSTATELAKKVTIQFPGSVVVTIEQQRP